MVLDVEVRLSPEEVAEKMMQGQFESPEEWLSELESCGVRLEPTTEEAAEDEVQEPPDSEQDMPEKEEEGPPPAPPKGPAIVVARMKAAKNAIKKGEKNG